MLNEAEVTLLLFLAAPLNDLGMIARNPKNHADKWYVARKYFEDSFEPASA